MKRTSRIIIITRSRESLPPRAGVVPACMRRECDIFDCSLCALNHSAPRHVNGPIHRRVTAFRTGNPPVGGTSPCEACLADVRCSPLLPSRFPSTRPTRPLRITLSLSLSLSLSGLFPAESRGSAWDEQFFVQRIPRRTFSRSMLPVGELVYLCDPPHRASLLREALAKRHAHQRDG